MAIASPTRPRHKLPQIPSESQSRSPSHPSTMLFLHALLLFFLLGITPSMAVVLPLGSRNLDSFRIDTDKLQGYWRLLSHEVSFFGGLTYPCLTLYSHNQSLRTVPVLIVLFTSIPRGSWTLSVIVESPMGKVKRKSIWAFMCHCRDRCSVSVTILFACV